MTAITFLPGAAHGGEVGATATVHWVGGPDDFGVINLMAVGFHLGHLLRHLISGKSLNWFPRNQRTNTMCLEIVAGFH